MSIRMRHTRGHSGNRRSHHALKQMSVVKDASSGALRLPHRLDETTGMYRGKQIKAPKVKKSSASIEKKTKAPNTSPAAVSAHDHAHDHANAKAKTTQGIFGKIASGGRPKARSGAGGGLA